MPSPLDVNNGLYNALCQGLGLSAQSFQIIQPSPPLVANSDAFLWNYFNNIPPHSLTQNYIASGGDQYFSNYNAVISALASPAQSRYEADVPENIRNAFADFIAAKNPPPSLNQFPALFRSWAFLRFPNVAIKGATDLASAILDPVAGAALALLPYKGDPTATPPIPDRLPDWDEGYTQLIGQLNQSPSRSFSFTSSNMNSNVSNTWSHGSNSGFFGLWGGSSSTSSQTRLFAESEFSVSAQFRHVLTFAATPGPWYSSAALGLAFDHKSGPPWAATTPPNPIDWSFAFDPQKGTLLRFMVNLIVVDTMSISVRSFARWSVNDQTTIHNNAGAGLWPFYVSNSSSGVSTSVTFGSDQTATITTTSAPGVPIVIGGNVLSVDDYLGHAIAGGRQFAEMLSANREYREMIGVPA